MGRRRGRRGPDRGERKHRPGAIRGSAAEPEVRRCLESGGTLREASTILNDKNGFSPSLTAIGRFWQSVRKEAEQARELEALAARVVRGDDDWPGCDLMVLARKLLMLRVVDAVHELPDDAFETGEVDRLSLILARLERTAAMTDRNRMRAVDLYKTARKELIEELVQGLYGRAEVLNEMRNAFPATEEEMERASRAVRERILEEERERTMEKAGPPGEHAEPAPQNAAAAPDAGAGPSGEPRPPHPPLEQGVASESSDRPVGAPPRAGGEGAALLEPGEADGAEAETPRAPPQNGSQPAPLM